MSVWQSLTDTGAGYLFNLSDSLRIVEAKNPNLLVPVSDGIMIVASDYSGQHKDASHEAYSFLVTTDLNLQRWLPILREFHEHRLPDGRRISFKKLNEPVRWRALPAYLETIGSLSGNLFTTLIDRRVGSFMAGGPKMMIKVFPDCFSADAKHGTVEKMFRLASFLALILSGLRREDQVSNWISDHDETLDTHDKREQFARLATYLTVGLTGWRQAADHLFGTTQLSAAPCWSEDVASVADLVAGAYCRMNHYLPAFFDKKSWHVVSSSNVDDQRARIIGHWLSTGQIALKHVLLRLEQDNSGDMRASAQAFVGQF